MKSIKLAWALILGGLCGAPLWAESVGEAFEEELGLYLDVPESIGEGQLNIRIVENQMLVYFLDKEGLLTDPPLSKLYVRWENVRNRTEDGYLSMSAASDGPYLTNPRKLFPPYHYRLTLIIPQEDKEDNLVLYGNVLRQ